MGAGAADDTGLKERLEKLQSQLKNDKDKLKGKHDRQNQPPKMSAALEKQMNRTMKHQRSPVMMPELSSFDNNTSQNSSSINDRRQSEVGQNKKNNRNNNSKNRFSIASDSVDSDAISLLSLTPIRAQMHHKVVKNDAIPSIINEDTSSDQENPDFAREQPNNDDVNEEIVTLPPVTIDLPSISSPTIKFTLPTKLGGGTRRSNYVKELLGQANIDTPSALSPFRNTATRFNSIEPLNFENEDSVMQIMKKMEI